MKATLTLKVQRVQCVRCHTAMLPTNGCYDGEDINQTYRCRGCGTEVVVVIAVERDSSLTLTPSPLLGAAR